MLSLAAAAFAFSTPSIHCVHKTTRHLRLHAAPVAALPEFTNILADAFSAPSTILPSEFAEFGRGYAPTSSSPKFSHVFMNAVGAYVLFSGAMTLIPLVREKIFGVDVEVQAARVARYLEAAPESSFGWHRADLRTPLPALEELEAFPIGVNLEGKRVYLCRAEEAIKYTHVEFSRDFTDHYGEKVYVCFV